jgi:hypothetical protein
MAMPSCDIKREKTRITFNFPTNSPFAEIPKYVVILCLSRVAGIYDIQDETSDRFSVGVRKTLFSQKDNTKNLPDNHIIERTS